MRADISLLGWRFYLDLSRPKPEVAESKDQPPTQLATPMRTVGYASRSAGLSEAAYDTNKVDPK